MGREKRKGRLNKTGDNAAATGNFIGFGAFAETTTPVAADGTGGGLFPHTLSTNSLNSNSNGVVRFSPIYTGPDATLALLFPKIGQKRDATTKSKALQDLNDFFRDEGIAKKTKAEALSHFLYLFHTKLYFDASSKVRAYAVRLCFVAAKECPKAWKNLVTSDTENETVEILGMLLCARADPALEVRSAANKNSEYDQDGNDKVQDEAGIWKYSQKILSYNKPVDMHMDLFQKKGGAGKTNNNSAKLSESQQEELEERYERIVGTTMEGIRLYLLGSQPATTAKDPLSVKFLWKTFASPRASLRRQTYSLLSTVCQLSRTDLVDTDKLSKLLVQSVSSEKEASNIGILLETVLAFIVSNFSKGERSSIMAKSFARPLSKLFKKGCHGAAPSSAWTPTILPLVALLPNDSVGDGLPLGVDLLTNVWEGRSHVVGVSDRCEVVRAVAETAAFLLAKEDSKEIDTEIAFDHILAQCWLQTLQSYLSTGGNNTTKNGKALANASRAHKDLGLTLARGWLQLERASNWNSNDTNKHPSSMYHIKDWFWDEELATIILAESTRNSNLTQLFTTIHGEREIQQHTVALGAASTLGKKFRSLFSDATKGDQTLVPNKDVYQLWIAMLQLITSLDEVFSSSDLSVDEFVMNRILSWTILHTSSLSDRCLPELALLDVRLVHGLAEVSDNPAKTFLDWWNPILREILSAKPDVQILTDCLGWLVRQGPYSASDLLHTRGDVTFSEFCIETAKVAVAQNLEDADDPHEQYGHDDDSHGEAFANVHGDDDYEKTCRFLRACVGLDIHRMPEPLVGEDVVDAWVECACPDQGDVNQTNDSNPVLDTLVDMIRNSKLSETRIQPVLLQSWRQGGFLWEDQCLPWLLQTENTMVRSSLIGNAGIQCKKRMEELSSSNVSAEPMDDEAAWDWTECAHRLIRLCSNEDGDNYTVPPSLGIIGLGDPSVWDSGSRLDYLSTCLMRLMRHIEYPSRRWELFAHTDTDTVELFVVVLINLSHGGESPLYADLARRREDLCANLLTDLEFDHFNSEQATNSIMSCISKLSSLLEGTTIETEKACRSLAVLSQLIGMRYSSLRPELKNDTAQEKLDPSNVQAGDKIWYITDSSDPFAQERCVVVKIHRDLSEEVYYTIQLDRNGTQQEKQTVGERLRKVRTIKKEQVAIIEKQTTISVNEIRYDEKQERDRIVGFIEDKLLKSIDVSSPFDVSYEIYNIIISQCGLHTGRGIGSAHYSVVQKLSGLQQQLLESLSSSDAGAKLVPTLWRLAFALGFGANGPSSEWSIPLVGLHSADTIPSLLRYDEDEKIESSPKIESAMAAWLSVCASACDDSSLRIQSYSLLFQLASRLLSLHYAGETGFHLNHYIALRAIEVGQVESHKWKEGESLIQESEAEALAELTKAFATNWTSTEEGEDYATNWTSLPLFDSIMQGSLNKRPGLMAIASRQCMNALAKSLYDHSKQKYAMRILHTYSNENRPLFQSAEGDDIINPKTLEQLDTWVEGMLDDEADNLEDDVASVAQWVCGELMNDVESWHNDDDVDEEVACGRMLSWLSVLDIADAATGSDSANRLAFTSYVTKSNAVGAMMDLALIYGNIGSDRKIVLDVVVPMEEIMESMSLSKLAARVISRSVEVFPTLSKNWWDSSCPKSLTQTIKEFVETQVSPNILKQAVQSIKNESAFGEMNVRGGSVTREINATYVQDDFTLSVLIKLPLSFPFRRAEVDCSNTVGVPEHRWKRWSLQITQMLNNQGETLKSALMLWKENVDKEFEGVEPCPVCYSVLHIKSHKLPNLACKTCNNSFHSDCLFEWFKNSGKSACVICQQPWRGTRIQ